MKAFATHNGSVDLRLTKILVRKLGVGMTFLYRYSRSSGVKMSTRSSKEYDISLIFFIDFIASCTGLASQSVPKIATSFLVGFDQFPPIMSPWCSSCRWDSVGSRIKKEIPLFFEISPNDLPKEMS